MEQLDHDYEKCLPFFGEDGIHSQQGGKIIGEEEMIRRIFAINPKRGTELLFRKYYTNLCNHAIRFIFSRDIAEEIVSEVFANFWQGRFYDKDIVSYPAYLYQAVRYRAYNHLRHELKRMVPLEALPPRHDAGPNPEEVLFYNDISRKIDRLIQDLPPQSRRAFMLSRFESMKYAEIAVEMNLSISAVERLINRALSRLRHGLQDEI